MQWTYGNLLQARKAVSDVLADLDLEAYLFAVEPRGETCEVRLEYAAHEGWKTHVFEVDDASLLSSVHDPETRRRLTHSFAQALGSAKRGPSAPRGAAAPF